MTAKTYQITTSRTFATIDIRDDKVVRASPVVRFMQGWNIGRVQWHCRRKKWSLTDVRLHVDKLH
jgi:hypothetical protein